MPSPGSVTGWLNQLQGGDAAAVERLWERYFHRLQGLARLKLPEPLRGRGLDEDAALDAIASFCRGVERGRFPELTGRDNLWRLLVVITARKVWHTVRGESRRPAATASGDELEQILERGPGPEFEAQAAEECRRLLDRLGDDRLAAVARWRLEGYTTAEIAERLTCSPRTVERKLQLIQTLWAEEVGA